MGQPSTEERVARYLAATDWLEDPTDDDWWNNRSAKFRDDWLTHARGVISIVRGADQPTPAHRPDDTTGA